MIDALAIEVFRICDSNDQFAAIVYPLFGEWQQPDK